MMRIPGSSLGVISEKARISGRTNRDEVGFGKTDFYGQGPDRSYEQMQADPGDYDAWVSQGPKNIHARENLCLTGSRALLGGEA